MFKIHKKIKHLAKDREGSYYQEYFYENNMISGVFYSWNIDNTRCVIVSTKQENNNGVFVNFKY